MNFAYNSFRKDPFILKLFNKYEALLRSITPEDCFQEAYIKFNKSIEDGRFRGDSTLKTFFVRIFTNTLVDALRLDIKNGLVSLTQEITYEIENYEEVSENDISNECLKKCLKKLAEENPKHAAIIMARHDYEKATIEKILLIHGKASKEREEVLQKIPHLINKLENLCELFAYSSINSFEVTISKIKDKLAICCKNCLNES